MTGRFERLGLRSRLMAIGLAGVAGALLLGGLLLYAVMSAALERATVNEARASAQDIAVLVNDGRLSDPLPVSGAQVVQVLDRQNRVVGGSATADRLTPIVTADERLHLSGEGAATVPGSRAGLEGSLRVAAVQAGPASDPLLVVAAVPTADLETSRRVLRNLMLVFFPLFLLVLAAIAWHVIGSALRPVEELRRGAQRIGQDAARAGRLTGGRGPAGHPERLPVPPTRDEIYALATTLNTMLEHLDTAGVRQRTFVADAAHELRSPLATMRTQLEVAQRLGDGGELAAELLPEVDRLSALVEDLLVLARADDTGPHAREEVDLAGLLEQVRRRYAGARVPVRVAFAERAGSGAVPASHDDLVRAVGNLVDNAVRHADTEVVLGWERRPGGARLTVRDDGHGIPEAELERVFDRFARLHEARDRDSGGSGLGLPITRELLRRNRARVWLEDAGPGVRAVVEFSDEG